MAKSTNEYLAELLKEYQDFTGKTLTEMALDFDVTQSNLYLYRSGKGNPTAKTVDKIVNEVEEREPKVYEKVKR